MRRSAIPQRQAGGDPGFFAFVIQATKEIRCYDWAGNFLSTQTYSESITVISQVWLDSQGRLYILNNVASADGGVHRYDNPQTSGTRSQFFAVTAGNAKYSAASNSDGDVAIVSGLNVYVFDSSGSAKTFSPITVSTHSAHSVTVNPNSDNWIIQQLWYKLEEYSKVDGTSVAGPNTTSAGNATAVEPIGVHSTYGIYAGYTGYNSHTPINLSSVTTHTYVNGATRYSRLMLPSGNMCEHYGSGFYVKNSAGTGQYSATKWGGGVRSDIQTPDGDILSINNTYPYSIQKLDYTDLSTITSGNWPITSGLASYSTGQAALAAYQNQL